MALGPAVFDRHIPAFDEADFAQTLAERGHPWGVSALRFAVEKPDYRHRRLLRARRERPRGRAAEKSNELAPFHVEHGGLPPRCAISAADWPVLSLPQFQPAVVRPASPWGRPEMF